MNEMSDLTDEIRDRAHEIWIERGRPHGGEDEYWLEAQAEVLAARAAAVRNAGPDEMRDPPRQWDLVDEQSDASFPASDPPGNY